ncbi:MAG TPA: ABC transporter permease subunit [Candidatus Dormibacteraeota bacterium]|nr:ABC transporter permease subunit [Candidatus Dormibacteraeota bacterium]
MFRSIYLKTLRDFRVPILGWGLGLGALMATVFAAVPSVFATPAAKAAVVSLGPAFAWIAEPIKIDTAGGYATWKYGITILVVVIWPLLAGTGMLRGEEERGSMDVLLSLPRGRVRIALEKLAAMWTALLAMGLLVGLLAFAGSSKVSSELSLGAALWFGVNLSLICGVFGSIAVLVSQFTQERRTASGLTAGILLVAIVVDMVHRVVPSTVWLSQFSPVYYYNLSKPLVPGYGVNPGAILVMLGLSVILSGAAIWLFARRDVGGVVFQLPRQTTSDTRALPQSDWSLRSVYARSVGMIATSTLWWTLAIAGLSAWMVVIVKQIAAQLRSLMQGSPALADFLKLGGSDSATNAALFSAFFIFMPILLMAFAVTQANRWSADEEDGLLELVLSTPQPRVRVLLGRFAAIATATIFISVLTLVTTAAASAATGVTLDGGNLAAASLSMIPLGLLVAAIGYLFAGWLRAAVETGLLSFLLVIWFFISFVGPGLNLPDATLRLSPLYYYGSPLLHGLQLTSVLGVLAVAALVLALGTYRFARKDIAT